MNYAATKRRLRLFLRQRLGVEIRLHGKRHQEHRRIPNYIDRDFVELFLKYREVSMVPWTGLHSAFLGIQYVVARDIPGSVIECGVFKGGCSALMAETLCRRDCLEKEVYLLDTFEGMSEPTEADGKDEHDDKSFDTQKYFEKRVRNDHVDWCYGPMSIVQMTMARSGYPAEKIHYVKGRVEETLPNLNVDAIALLRLDTDWYESTLAELEHLYDHVSPGGVILIDDYGAWAGARKATTDFLSKLDSKPFMQLDYSYGGLTLVKI